MKINLSIGFEFQPGMGGQLAITLYYFARYTALKSPKKDETAVRGCICWLFPNSYSYHQATGSLTS